MKAGKRKADTKCDPSWVTRQALAKMLGVTVGALKVSLFPHIPESAVRNHGPGKPIEYHAPTVMLLWSDRRIVRLAKDDPDPLMEGCDGDENAPALERYRMARAKLSELELQERKGELCSIVEFQRQTDPLARILRRAGERLQRRFGNDALAILNSAIDEFEAGCSGLTVAG